VFRHDGRECRVDSFHFIFRDDLLPIFSQRLFAEVFKAFLLVVGHVACQNIAARILWKCGVVDDDPFPTARDMSFLRQGHVCRILSLCYVAFSYPDMPSR
jgi:hypothetical protein